MIFFGQKKLTPQEIECDGNHKINNKIIALDASPRSIRMKSKAKEVTLKMNKSETSKLYRVYKNKE